MNGRSPSGPGSRPSDRAASVSAVPASIPNAADELATRAQLLAIDEQIARFQRVDWDGWERDDPWEAQKGWRQYQQLQQVRGQVAGRLAKLAEAREGALDAEVERILAMTDEQVLAEASPEDIGWAKGFKEGLRLGLRAAQGTEARRAETGTGSVHDGPVAEGDAPKSTHDQSGDGA